MSANQKMAMDQGIPKAVAANGNRNYFPKLDRAKNPGA